MSMAMERYQQWLTDTVIDNQTKQELEGIRNQTQEIEDRFYRDLEFGTGGLRGVMGAGTNRLNVYTVSARCGTSWHPSAPYTLYPLYSGGL